MNGGTFGGTGSVTGPVTVNSTGSISPGSPTTPIAALNTGALSLSAGSTFVFGMNSNASLSAAADLLNANGTLCDRGFRRFLSISDAGNTVLPANTKFTLISYTGTWDGHAFDTYADDSIITVGANQFVLNYNDTSGGSNFSGGTGTGFVTLTAVPEANSFVLGAAVCLASGVAVARQRLRSKRSEI